MTSKAGKCKAAKAACEEIRLACWARKAWRMVRALSSGRRQPFLFHRDSANEKVLRDWSMLGDEHATEQHQHNGLRAASGFHGSSIPAHDMGLKAIRQTRMHSAENASDEELTGVNDRLSLRRMSWWLYAINFASAVVLLTAYGFLTFLWFSADDNPTWRKFANNDWITQTTTILSALIRLATGAQATTASCMLASVMLENGDLPLKQLANISTSRTNASPVALWWSQLQVLVARGIVAKGKMLPMIITLLLLPNLALQFTSTILVTDIRSGLVSGFPLQLNTAGPLNVSPIYRLGSSWNQNLRTFPSFAEYSQKEARQTKDGISDTGPVLRAFLPFVDERERSIIQQYQGIAAVVDARVMCVRPNMTNVTLVQGPRLMSEMSIPAELRSRPVYPEGQRKSWRLHVPYQAMPDVLLNCTIGSPPKYSDPGNGYNVTLAYYHEEDWLISLCRFDSGNYLMPETLDMDYNSVFLPRVVRMPYLVVNISGWFDNSEFFSSDAPDRFLPSKQSNDGEWLRLIFERNWTREESIRDTEYTISVSMCFPSFYSTALPISAYSPKNRTEPVAGPLRDPLRFRDVRDQLGQFGDDLVYRGLLELQNQDWVRNRDPLSEIGYMETAGDDVTTDGIIQDSNGHSDYYIAFSLQDDGSQQYYADSSRFASPDVATLFQEILRTGGGISFALQSVLTLFAASAYYDQASVSQSPANSPSNQTRFITVQIPGGNSQYLGKAAGFRPGYTVVTCLILLHSIVVSWTTWLFYSTTKISTLHNVWQTVAQLSSNPASDYIARASLADDDQVEQWVDEDGLGKELVGIRRSDSGTGTEIYGVRHRVVSRLT